VTALASAQWQPQALALDASSVYFTDYGSGNAGATDGTVLKVSKGGGAVTTLASAQAWPTRLAVNASGVYWFVYDGSTSSIMKSPLAPGAVTTFVAGSINPTDIVADTANVYFADYADGSLKKVPAGGGTPAALAVNVSAPLALDATSVYFTASANLSESIMRTPK